MIYVFYVKPVTVITLNLKSEFLWFWCCIFEIGFDMGDLNCFKNCLM